jgi:hypothetical protein
MEDSKDKVVVTEITDRGPSGWQNFNAKHDPDLKFWRVLGKKVKHGPAVRIGSYDRHRGIYRGSLS